MILRAYMDDSNMNQEPVSALAGWIAPADRWAPFADEWQGALDLKPRLRYFKMNECMSSAGEFSGWSEESRDLRLKYLIGLIEEYELLGIGGSIVTRDYREIFHHSPNKTFDAPYFLMFFGMMAGVANAFAEIQNELSATARVERLDFVFDHQPGQVDKVLSAWLHFKEVAPENVKPLLRDPPIFRDDITTLPLQAADLIAWHFRMQVTVGIDGGTYQPPWGNKGDAIRIGEWIWRRQNLEVARAALNEASRLGVPVEIWQK